MHERADRLAGGFLSVDGADHELEREFEARLVESSTLAFRVAYSVLRQREDAEDVAQEAFAKAYRNFRQLRDRTRFRAWLARMTWRLAIDRYRATNRRKALELNAEVENGATTTQAMAERDRAERLWAAIDALPEKFRMVIVLASIQGHEVSEVAALLGIPPGTVKSRLFVARQRLKEQLQCPVNPANR
jgi:RNA polymerase sigma-70 factor (ECF subfamily)